jgi:sugar lactone lactonase YvrE
VIAVERRWRVVALRNGGALARCAPDLPLRETAPALADRPTSCAFGGPDGATLLVTTSRDGFDEATPERRPSAGYVLHIVGLGAAGRPAPPTEGR